MARSIILLVLFFLTAESARTPDAQKIGIYFPIPIGGQIVLETTLEYVKKYLKEAEEVKPDVIVFEIDTNSGTVVEKERIVDYYSARHRITPAQNPDS